MATTQPTPPPPRDPLRDLELLVRSSYSVVHIHSADEGVVDDLVRRLAERIGVPLFSWSSTKGLRREGMGPGYRTTGPAQALQHIESSRLPAIYHMRGLGRDLEDRAVVDALRDAAGAISGGGPAAIVLGGTGFTLPDALGAAGTTVELPAPDASTYLALLKRVVRELGARMSVKVAVGPDDVARIVQNLRGLTLAEAEKIITKVIVDDGRLSPEDIQAVAAAKRAILGRDGLLEPCDVEGTLDQVAGLSGLKAWLGERRAILADPARAAQFGLSFPKGVLLLGVPGCGKSLCAKAVAAAWGLPLLRLDPGSIFDKYMGESEKNFKRALETAERMAPAVLWIDELEKAFGSSAGERDGGATQRIFGTFLSWLQDRKGDVFVVATANDVSVLPPEFLRKGRFDEIFFVDLPGAAARASVLKLHLQKKGKDPSRFDLARLTAATDGFSGAEIEQAIVGGLYTAFSAGTELTTERILEETARTRPLSTTMSEKIAWLREWARERARSAG